MVTNATHIAHGWSSHHDQVPGLLLSVTVSVRLKRPPGRQTTETTGRKPRCTLAIMLEYEVYKGSSSNLLERVKETVSRLSSRPSRKA